MYSLPRYQFYIKAKRYGNPELKNELQGYINAINARNEAIRKKLKVGDEFYFGTNSGKAICWKVLLVLDGMTFVISSDTICNNRYHNDGGKTNYLRHNDPEIVKGSQ